MTEFFVVQTNPQREAFVADLVRDFEPYLPQIKTGSGRIAPLFPSYLFVRALERWSVINRVMGVRGVLMSGDHPARIHERVINHWRSQERSGLVQLPPPPRFRKGERLMILRGTLRYRTALYAGMAGKDRERVLIEMLGSMVTLNIPTADLVSESSPTFRHHLRRNPKTR
jgi:transcription antitermination factor NusG